MGRSGSKEGKETERGFLRKEGLRMERNSSRASGGRAAAEGGRDKRSGGSVVMSAMKENSESGLRVKRVARRTGRGATTIGRSFDMAGWVRLIITRPDLRLFNPPTLFSLSGLNPPRLFLLPSPNSRQLYWRVTLILPSYRPFWVHPDHSFLLVQRPPVTSRSSPYILGRASCFSSKSVKILVK